MALDTSTTQVIRSERTARWRAYPTLVKSLQTGLLVLTGIAGFSSAHAPDTNLVVWAGLAASLSLSIGGSTVLNMVYDRDIDGLMQRTCSRPLPTGIVSLREALIVGTLATGLGILLALRLSPLYGLLIVSGVFFDLVVYTLWMKRRSPWSVVWGGLAGAVPILAGRALALGAVDAAGIALCLSVFLWIPTHILTFSLRYESDYRRARIPTMPQRYGHRATRLAISLSSLGAAFAMTLAALLIGMGPGYLRLLGVLSLGLVGLAIRSTLRPSPSLNFALFKYASVFMLSGMIVIVLETMA